jgi:GNAT superfamily N-acetyltransferase
MDLKNVTICRLTDDFDVKTFDCGHEDVNKYLYEEALIYQNKLMTVVNLLLFDKKIVAYYSLVNHSITVKDAITKKAWAKFKENVSLDNEPFFSIASVNIGFMGVDKRFKNSGIGHCMIETIKKEVLSNRISGSRFITVNAYKEVISFYEKNDFTLITTADKRHDTRFMYYDLLHSLLAE